jgi:hypothetical protein
MENAMKACGVVVLLLLASGCATTRVVNLDIGQGVPITYQPVDTRPIKMGESEFKTAVAQLVLDMRMDLGLEEPTQDEQLSLLASAGTGGLVDGVQGRTVPPSSERMCQQQSNPNGCLSLLAGGLTLGTADTTRKCFGVSTSPRRAAGARLSAGLP